ncbi:AI-2E family transporter [Candidatus Fermentibacteria bacterium]|nr:AI-2E family transporter [Candidatus Fermentibacteria bacterium]
MSEKAPLALGIGALGLLFYVLFLWRVAPLLSPLLLAILVWVVLYPERRSPWAARVLATTTALLLLWFLRLTWRALTPFFWGGTVVYLLNPFVNRLQRLRIPRLVASLTLGVFLIAVIVAIGILVLPTAAGQIREIINRLPDAAASADRWLASAQRRLQELGVPLEAMDVRERILSVDAILSRMAHGALGVTKALTTAFSAAVTAMLVVVVSFYTLLRMDRLMAWLRALVPNRLTGVRAAFREIDTTIGSWFRGQLLVALLVGSLTAAGLAVLSAPYAALIGLVAGALNIIPTIGLMVSVAFAALLAPTVAQPWSYLLKVGIVFAVLQVLDNFVISVQIMRVRMKLHPAVIILSVVAGASLFGVAGVFLAVPAAGLIRLGGQWALARYRSSAYYASSAPSAPSEEESPDAA